MTKFLTFIVLTFVFFGCSTVEVNIDYDDSYDFKKVKTFAVDSSFDKSGNSLFKDRVVNALENELELKKYKKVSIDKADLIFVFNSSIKDKADIHTSYGVSRYRGYRYGGMMIETTNTYEYTEGTLIIDALDKKTKKIVWRGIGIKELKNKKTLKERTEAINKSINKIVEKFPSILNTNKEK